MKLLVRK